MSRAPRLLGTDGRPRVCLVTGASKGMGRAHSLALAREGAHVVLTDLSSQTAAGEAVAKEIEAIGGKAIFLPLDVTKESDWERVIVETERAFGGLHVLVNNAGGAFREETPENMEFGEGSAWRKTLALNLDGVAMGTKWGMRLMKKTQGADRKSIINISSLAGLKGIIGSYAYGAAKGAVNIYSKSAAIYASRFGININTVHPGSILTDFHSNLMGTTAAGAEQADKIAARSAIRKPLMPEDVSGLIVYLASLESAFATATSYSIDAGMANM
ncbi:dehydrogenase [Hyaloraphidium curvatum]|nr:dehydrogenase [Hyaloraphidium curvatum]